MSQGYARYMVKQVKYSIDGGELRVGLLDGEEPRVGSLDGGEPRVGLVYVEEPMLVKW